MYELLNISAFAKLTVNSLPGIIKLYKMKACWLQVNCITN